MKTKTEPEKKKLDLKLLDGVIEVSQKPKLKINLRKILKFFFSPHQEITLEEWNRLEEKPRRSNVNRCPMSGKYL